MTVSTLAVTYVDITKYVAVFAGWDITEANWTTGQIADFGLILEKGLRRFYFPPVAPGEPRYEWAFLNLIGTLATVKDQEYADIVEDTFSGQIRSDSVMHQINDEERRLQVADFSDIRAANAKLATADVTAAPLYYALIAQTPTYTAQQRWRMYFHPIPDAVYTLEYEYVAMPNVITSTNKYPAGGDKFGDVILEAILAAAEEHLDDDIQGVHATRFQELLTAAMRLDAETKSNKETR